jgi:hypothetical protein
MIRHFHVKQINVLEQVIVSQEFATFKYIKLIFLRSGLKDCNDIVPLKDDKELSNNFAISEITDQYCIPGSEHVKPVGFIIVPESVNVFSVRDVHKSLPVQKIVGPMRDVEREVIVDEDSKRLAVSFIVDRALITSVAVING